MLFLNISSDKVHITDGTQEQFLERNGIENVLGPVLVQWYRERPWSQIFVLNGPGGFTNLRVGVLSLNLLTTLLGGDLQMFTCTKIHLYKYLIKKGFLPVHGLVYLGQKKNVWKLMMQGLDFSIQQMVLDDICTKEDYFLDYVSDESYRKDNDSMISFTVKEHNLTLSCKGKSLIITPQELGLSPVREIKAEYLMEATVN